MNIVIYFGIWDPGKMELVVRKKKYGYQDYGREYMKRFSSNELQSPILFFSLYFLLSLFEWLQGKNHQTK